jgi:hypothetical protein
MIQFYRRILIAAWLCVGAHTGAQAEMLQFSTPDGMKSWPKVNGISDWHQDQESSVRLNANFMIPDGVDPANAEVTVEARGFSRINNSLTNLLENDRAASPGAQVKKLEDVFDKDGTPFTLYSLAPTASGYWKAVAYSEEGDTLLAFTLSARSQAVYEKNLPIFIDFVKRYAKDIPW